MMFWLFGRSKRATTAERDMLLDEVIILETALRQMSEHFIRKCPEMTKLGIDSNALSERYRGYAQQRREPPL